MILFAVAAVAWPAVVPEKTAATEETQVATAVEGATRFCERWILDPSTWTTGTRITPETFPERAGLARFGLQSLGGVPDVALPEDNLRRALHFWRLPAGRGGVYVSASDQLPVCHLAGGGPDDWQPGIETALASGWFLSRWTAVGTEKHGDMVTTKYINKSDPKMWMIVSRAAAAGQRTDHVQFLITVNYKLG